MFEGPLICANAGAFADAARDLVDCADPPARVVVVDCEAMLGIEYTGGEALEGLVEDTRARSVEFGSPASIRRCAGGCGQAA